MQSYHVVQRYEYFKINIQFSSDFISLELDKQQTDAEQSQGCVYEKQFSRDTDAQIIGQ